MNQLKLSGLTHSDTTTLEKFSKDASSYRIQPALVAEPRTEADVIATVDFARKEGLSITPRGGGSGLSGAGIGNGIIINFKKFMHQVPEVGEETTVQPGAILDAFLAQMRQQNRMLPSVPSSSALCTLGGNIGTRSTGPRTARYGTIDAFLTSLKFVTANGELVDTRQPLPEYLTRGLETIRAEYLTDEISRQIIAQRPFIAGGYNLNALEEHASLNTIAAHLMVGSVGTLGLVTEIHLKLIPYRVSRGTFVAHFRDFAEFADAANHIKTLNPAALEFADASCLRHVNGKILNFYDPSLVGTLLVEFDESLEQAHAGRAMLEKYGSSALREIQPGSTNEDALWEDRRRILPSLWKYAREQKWLLPSIIDDIAIHLADFGAVHHELTELMQQLGHEISFFGHLGFGSVHARPYFNPAQGDWVNQIMTVSRESFKILQKYHGTLVGEHNAGRSRSVYLIEELGPAYRYLEKIKHLFDPDDVLNPGAIFNPAPIYQNMDFEN
jgi:FAD/FMN-containing dehydrogenase